MATDWRPLENYLNRIVKYISFKNEERQQFTHRFWKVLIYIVNCMKIIDEVFKKSFQDIELAGSYADRIKVSAPNEFDVLILLKFPNPVPVISRSGYVTVNIENSKNTWWGWRSLDKKYKRFIDHEGYLIQDQILGWLRELTRKILLDHQHVFNIDGIVYKIQQYNSGPAVTLRVFSNFGKLSAQSFFDIDLVGALRFLSSESWVASRQINLPIPKYRNAIPKPTKSLLHGSRDWICSYAAIEREFINNLNRFKPLIKIFKKIRDKADLTNLKSYYIKTIFLHYHLKTNENWNQSLATLFMVMFDVILEHLETKTLFSLWHHDYNMFDSLDYNQINSIYYKLLKIKRDINRNLLNKNPEYIYSVILTDSEQKEMNKKEEDLGYTCTIL